DSENMMVRVLQHAIPIVIFFKHSHQGLRISDACNEQHFGGICRLVILFCMYMINVTILNRSKKNRLASSWPYLPDNLLPFLLAQRGITFGHHNYFSPFVR